MRDYIRDFAYACKVTAFRDLGLGFAGPSRLHIALTYRCNSRCKMCSIWKIYKKDASMLSKEFTFEEFKKIIDNYPYFHDIWLTGGEPLLKEDAVKIMQYIDKKTKAWFSFNTNAIMYEFVKKKVEKLLKTIKNDWGMGISIDGFEKTHDMQRGVKGNWKSAMKLLDFVFKEKRNHKNFHPSITITITKWNLNEVVDFVDFLVNSKGISPKEIVMGMAVSSETYYHNKNFYTPNFEKLSEVLKTLMKKYPEYRTMYFKGWLKYLKKPFKMKCYAAFSFDYVDPYLNVYPCIYFNKPIGNLREYNYDIMKLWKSRNAFEIREKVKRHECPPCPWNACIFSPNVASNPVLGIKKVMEKFLTK